MRLIDADEMIENLGTSDRDIYFKGLIEEQPTAYAVEEIVRELEKHQEDYAYPEDEDYIAGHYDAFRMAIEIVKGGVK